MVVLSGDVPLVSAEAIAGLVEAHEQGAARATMATTVLADPSGYGRVVRDERGAVAKVVETKTAGDATAEELKIREVNTGIYAFAGEALLAALPRLSADNAQGELYLPQVLDLLRDDGAVVAAHAVQDAGLVLGVNDRVGLEQVRALAQRRILEGHMRAGVTVVDAGSTWIDVDVRIGRDARIEPGSSGETTVGDGALVGPHTTAIDSRIGARAEVRVSWLQDAEVQERAKVGPFALLAPGGGAARGVQGGDVRGDQELRYRGRGEGAAPLLHRRRRRWRELEPWCGHDHGELRRSLQAPHDDRRAGAWWGGYGVRGAGEHRR